MDIRTFLISIERSYIAKGLPSDTAREKTLMIARGLTAADRQRIGAATSEVDAGMLTAEYIARADAGHERAPEPEPVRPCVDDDIKIKSKGTTKVIKKVSKPEPEEDLAPTFQVEAVAPVKTEKVELTERGKVFYRIWMRSKGVGYAALAVLIGFAAVAVYALIAALIAALVGLLVAVAVAGVIATLAGLIYGIIKLFSVTPEGLYEIGLALIILGVTLAASIGLYNLAIRIVPMLWKRLTIFLKEKKEEYRAFLNDVRTECNEK